MGKRQFKKPDESESEYEWEEAQRSPPNKKNLVIGDNIDLNGFLSQYTSKSRNDVLMEKKEAEKKKEEELVKSRTCSTTEAVVSHSVDFNWLRRVYYRIKEQSEQSGGELGAMLRERYDEKTVRMMEDLCGKRGAVRESGGHNSRRRGDSSNSYIKDGSDQRNNRVRNKTRNNVDYEISQKNELRNHQNSGRNDKNDKEYSPKDSQNVFSQNKYKTESRNNDDYQSYSKTSKNKNIYDSKDVEERYVTLTDINDAAAALLKAELSGNNQKLIKLQKRIEILREAQRRNLKVRLTKQKKEIEQDRSVMIEKSLKNGRMVPYMETGNKFASQSCVFEDMKREEDATNADEGDWIFASTAGKISSNQSRYEETGEREYASSSQIKTLTKQKEVLISAQKRRTTQVNNCKCCYKNMPKHMVLSKGEYFYLIVPMDLGITDYHLQLLPIDHISASTRLDDDSWSELVSFKEQIAKFFNKEFKSECVFMETVMQLNNHPHMKIDCIPLADDRDNCFVSNKVFFRKAIEEAKSEWCQNKKIIDVIKGDIRRSVPKEFPYFAVDFVSDGGLAMVIDDERKFSNLFGLEIIGSMLDKNQFDIKNRKEKKFNQLIDAVLKVENKWKNFNLWKTLDSDDSD